MAHQERILILEDDAAFARLLAETLSDLGVCRFTSYPERLHEIIKEFNPTLLIVDYNLNHPTLDGIKATRLIRRNPETNLLPILLLSGEDNLAVIEEAFKSGIDDYVLKPVIPRFLNAKIENLLFQSRKKLNAQALSGLPGNAAIETEFYLRLQKKRPFSVSYTDLDNFKPFNDEKGVKQGDLAIQALSKLLHALRGKQSRHQLFVGHLGGDDFFLLGSASAIKAATQKLKKDFSGASRVFFTEQELAAGYYRGTDRNGHLCSFPLLGLSSAIIDGITAQTVPDFLRLTEIAAAVKKAAKKSETRICHVSAASIPQIPPESLYAETATGAKKVAQKKRVKIK
ncbi:MAG: response regulator [Leptospiraceae bacterium]|nr:response regulator [Leptospiraceae bacterium]